MCLLNNKPCIHTQPDDLENCRYCEKYSTLKYLKYLNNKRKKEKLAKWLIKNGFNVEEIK